MILRLASVVRRPSSVLFLACLGLYTLTLAPGLLPADAGEYQVTGALLGVAHPPGFALYTLASWLISRLPFVSPAAAINWLSALLAAATTVLVARSTTKLTRSRVAGLGAALALGFSTTFWAQSTTANIRMPAAFATALALERLIAYRAALLATTPSAAAARGARSVWTVAGLALALGLGVSHHGSLAFIAAVFVLYALRLNPGSLRRPWPWLAGALPFVAWLYFPLRAGAFGAPPGIATLNGFLEHVLARGFRGDLFFFASAGALPGRLAVFGNILTVEFVTPVLALMALGAVAAFRRDRDFAVVLLAAAGLHSAVAITYRAPQTVEYLLPAYVLMAVWVGFGLSELTRAFLNSPIPAWADNLALAAVAVLVALPLALQLKATAPSYLALARDDGTRAYAQRLLAEAPPGALVLSTWHWANPLWYLQTVEGQRPDVEVRYVFPQGESLALNWVDAIRSELPRRPVVVTSFYTNEYQTLPYRFVPLGPAWEVRAEPLTAAPPGLRGQQAFGAWSFLGYQFDAVTARAVIVRAAWQTTQTPEDISFFMHLLDANGELVSQFDVAHPAAGYAADEVLVDRYSLALPPDAAPGLYTLAAGAYRPDGQRVAETRLGEVRVPAQPVMLVRAPHGATPMGAATGALWLTGSEISPRGPVRPGGSLTVRLHFMAAQPITGDYAVSVALIPPDYRWHAQSDGTPAGGAIPTLKWIAGSRVTDTRTLTIPPEAAPGSATLSVVVYDSFAQQNLAVFDAALAALGPGMPLGTIEIVAP